MKKKIIMLLLMYTPLLANAQDENQGVHFEQNLSWQQIIAKAKKENKYIFVDCYATWCGPCKRMNQEVFSSKKVGDIVNTKFISVEVQMDSTKNDNDYTKSWYTDVHGIITAFKVAAYPTFLFFSPDGKVLHRGLGYKNDQEFIKLATDAINVSTQYYALLENYKNGKKDVSSMAYLLSTATTLGDRSAVKLVGRDYTNIYLNHLNNAELMTKENLSLLRRFTESSKEKGFELFFRNPDQVDKIMGAKGYAKSFLDNIISKEELLPDYQAGLKSTDKELDWVSLSNHIAQKYNQDYADRNIARYKVYWYKAKRNWPEYTKWAVMSIQKFASKEDLENILYINDSAWGVFSYSDKKTELEAAAQWMKGLISKNPDFPSLMDTYANLLYKLGTVKEAVEWESKAAQLNPKDDQIQSSLAKMKNNERTWLLPEGKLIN